MKEVVTNDFEYHTPVLAAEVTRHLITNFNGRYADCTLGGGGHSELILKKLSSSGKLLGLDRDPDALQWCREKFVNDNRMEIIGGRFSELQMISGEQTMDGILMDLGVSSHQLNSDDRGFSFRQNVPLDMRMNPTEGVPALEYLQNISENDLEKAFSRNSDMPRSKTLAREIKKLAGKYSDSEWLSRAVDKVYPKGVMNKPQMMARIFQAIRIEVNEEKNEVERGISCAVKSLKKGGRLLVISFHSAEDRWVKKTLNSFEKNCICPRDFPVCTCGGNHRHLKKIVKKPLVPSAAEVKTNIRARSAKLRVMEKTAA